MTQSVIYENHEVLFFDVKKMMTMIWLYVILLLTVFYIFRLCMKVRRLLWKKKKHVKLSVGFFHPYCNAGGGGERVLWCAVRSIQNRYKNIHCVIYTGDTSSGVEILEKAEKCFNVTLPAPVEFIHLKTRCFVEAKYYPLFTILGQSLGSVILGLEAAFRHVPDIYIDTMGYAFTYPIFRFLFSCRIGAYVHYPTISVDMFLSVSERRVAVNNKSFISNNALLSHLKLSYYKFFAILYYFMGRRSEVIMVNSSWTLFHISKLWKKPNCTYVVYPPCDIYTFETLPMKSVLNKQDLRIISIAQFRPEKDHKLQLDAFKAFLDRSDENHAKLILIGSCRHEEDNKRVKELKSYCSQLGIEEHVEFKTNLTFEEVLQEMKNADIALHSMVNEHFGIGIVECISAGLIMIAHDSGGPKLDIITEGETGFLAYDVKSYADALETVSNLSSDEIVQIRLSARESMTRFSVEKFEDLFLSVTSFLFDQLRT